MIDHTWTKRGGQDALEQMEKYREVPEVVRMSGAEYEAQVKQPEGRTHEELVREWMRGGRER